MKLSLLVGAALLLGAPSLRAQDTFDASPEKVHVREKPSRTTGSTPAQRTTPSIPAKAERVVVRVGGIVPVMESHTGRGERAFYLPPEATRIAQVVKEKKGGKVTYFIKGHAPGKTVGGAVERAWLDKAGFRANNSADEARIQLMVRTHPLYIEVR
jgi:hypothetical protein